MKNWTVGKKLVLGFSVVLAITISLGGLAVWNGVKIAGPLNLAGTIAVNASSLFAKNLFAFLEIMLDKKEQKLAINWDDELVKGTLVAKDAKIVHPNLAQQS